MPETTHIRAHAKVNLALSVGTPVPADQPGAGLHPIASWMAPIDLADDIEFEPAEGGGITLDLAWADDAPTRSPIVWPQEQDLCVRAANRLSSHTGRELSGTIRVLKRIPAGGGLGGGSADAAATLVAINASLGLGLDLDTLAEIASTLGSDIPFFLDDTHPPRPALVTGFGERVERVSTRPASLLLVIPSFGCATADVYHAFDEEPITLDERTIAAMAADGLVDPARLFNDLASPAKRTEPRLRDIFRLVEGLTGLPVHLSGSGSTMFVVTDDAPRIANDLSLRVPSNVAFVPCTTLDPSA